MKSICNLKLIVISSPVPVAGEVELINELFATGLQIFHLRKDGIDLQRYQLMIEQVDPHYHDRLVLHQFHELADHFNINRLHYKENDRTAVNQQEKIHLLSEKYRLSSSVHSSSKLSDIKGFEYVFYGPVFDSISKPGYPKLTEQAIPLNRLKKPELIALGGIDAVKIEQVNPDIFDGVAVLGAIWNVPEDAIKNFKKIQEQCQKTALT